MFEKVMKWTDEGYLITKAYILGYAFVLPVTVILSLLLGVLTPLIGGLIAAGITVPFAALLEYFAIERDY